MRYCMSVLLSLFALEWSHSWQTQVPMTRAHHWRHSSASTTQLQAGLDPELVPALTASTALFVGAAGALFYNRVLANERTKVGDAKSAEALLVDTTEAVKMQDAAELEAEISQVIKEEMAKESKVEKVKAASSSAKLADPAYRTSTRKPVSTPATDKSNAKMELKNGETITSLNERPSKSTNEKPAVTVEASLSDLKPPSTEMKEPPTEKVKGISTVGEPQISPTSEERALGSLSRDNETEPSFISLLETSQKTNTETNDEDSTIPASFDKTVASDKPKENKPAIKVAMNPSSTSASTAGTVAPPKQIDNESLNILQNKDSSPASSPEKEPARNAWLPSKRGVNMPSKSSDISEKETAASVSTPSVPASGVAATTLPAKETVKASVATPASNVRPAATKATSFNKSAATTVGSQPASSNKNEATSSKPKIRLNIKETPTKENGSSRSTNDAVQSIPKPTNMNNGATPKPPVTETETTVSQVTEPTSTTTDTAKQPDVSLKSILAPETGEFDEDTAFDSLQQYIQNKARDMTLKRMGEKAGFDVLQPIVKEESRVVKPDKIKRESIDDKLPVFMAPNVDDPYAEMKAKDDTAYANVDINDDQVATNDSSDSDSSDEQVAKSLKKSQSRSLTKKAQKSVVLVAVATCAVFVGKRLASVVIGRGML